MRPMKPMTRSSDSSPPPPSSASSYRAGFGLTGGIAVAKANLKAIGVLGLDDFFGLTDATILFNSQFAFDFDNRDGVDAGLIDFTTVAAHEIGHALGFTSIVDDVDFLLEIGGFPEMSRFTPWTCSDSRIAPGLNPRTTGEFTVFPRLLVPGFPAITDEILDSG